MKRLLTFLDSIGSAGALFAAIAAPCCFPLFAGAIASVGLVALGESEGLALYALQGFALLSLFGLALGVRKHHTPWPFALGVTSVVALAWAFYGTFSHSALYGGLFGLLGFSCVFVPSQGVSCHFFYGSSRAPRGFERALTETSAGSGHRKSRTAVHHARHVPQTFRPPHATDGTILVQFGWFRGVATSRHLCAMMIRNRTIGPSKISQSG